MCIIYFVCNRVFILYFFFSQLYCIFFFFFFFQAEDGIRDLTVTGVQTCALPILVSISRRVLGEEHPNTLLTRRNLAALLRDRGDLVTADAELQAVLSIYRKVLDRKSVV